MYREDIQYSAKYDEDGYVYRYVILPDDVAEFVPKTRLMTEFEWRNMGIEMSSRWRHYDYLRYDPTKPPYLLFRKRKNDNVI